MNISHEIMTRLFESSLRKKQNTDSEYLAKPLIEGAEFTITYTHVKITTPSTIHAEARRVPPLPKNEFTAVYKIAINVAKRCKAKISYTRHIRRDFIDRWDEYVSAWHESDELFCKIVKQAKVVQQRGIHHGTIDDSELKALQELCHAHQASTCGSSIISRVTAEYRRLVDIEEKLKRSESGTMKIYL